MLRDRPPWRGVSPRPPRGRSGGTAVSAEPLREPVTSSTSRRPRLALLAAPLVAALLLSGCGGSNADPAPGASPPPTPPPAPPPPPTPSGTTTPPPPPSPTPPPAASAPASPVADSPFEDRAPV